MSMANHLVVLGRQTSLGRDVHDQQSLFGVVPQRERSAVPNRPNEALRQLHNEREVRELSYVQITWPSN
jgi:hypothetical protein